MNFNLFFIKLPYLFCEGILHVIYEIDPNARYSICEDLTDLTLSTNELNILMLPFSMLKKSEETFVVNELDKVVAFFDAGDHLYIGDIVIEKLAACISYDTSIEEFKFAIDQIIKGELYVSTDLLNNKRFC